MIEELLTMKAINLIDSFITLCKNKKIDSKNQMKIKKSIQRYLENSYKSYSNINTVVFKNQQKKIWELYIPLTISCNENKEKIKVENYIDSIINKYKKIIIVDTAGMGKSTIIRWLFLKVIEEEKGIPILIDLRKLSNEKKVINCILDNINDIDNNIKENEILELFKGGNFIFFLDGYDEISNKYKKTVTEDLQSFIARLNNNLFIMSSRAESELYSFGDFQEFNINKLNKTEAFSLIRKYDKDGELSKELIDAINSDENLHIVKEFLTNPLMTSLLYKAYEYNKTIPYKKHLFYEQIFYALFDEHDLTKGGAYKHEKNSGLDRVDFLRMLKYISYVSFFKNNNEYTENYIIDLIKESMHKYNLTNFKEVDFLKDITHAVPLLIKDGLNYRWVHKSFQEYFASLYICQELKSNQNEMLKRMYKSNNSEYYYNILDFCYDLDVNSFEESIIIDLINDYIRYMEEKDAILTDKDILRKSLTYAGEYIIKRTENPEEDINKLNMNTKFHRTIILNQEMFIRINMNYKNNIITLLYNKNNTIVKNIINRQNKLKDIYKLEINKLYKFNSKTIKDDCSTIDLLSNIITHYNNSRNMNSNTHLILDLDECIKAKQRIEKRIENDKNNDLPLI